MLAIIIIKAFPILMQNLTLSVIIITMVITHGAIPLCQAVCLGPYKLFPSQEVFPGTFSLQSFSL